MAKKSKTITIRMDEDLKIKLDIHCATHQTSITELLTDYIKKLIEEEKEMLTVIYTDKTDNDKRYILAEITANHSMEIDEALALADVNMDDWAHAQGWDGYDYESITMEVK